MNTLSLYAQLGGDYSWSVNGAGVAGKPGTVGTQLQITVANVGRLTNQPLPNGAQEGLQLNLTIHSQKGFGLTIFVRTTTGGGKNDRSGSGFLVLPFGPTVPPDSKYTDARNYPLLDE